LKNILLSKIKTNMETEYAEIRFGATAVKKGFVTTDDILKALSVQVHEDLASGEHRPLGTILLDQKLITATQLKEVLKAIEGYDDRDGKKAVTG